MNNTLTAKEWLEKERTEVIMFDDFDFKCEGFLYMSEIQAAMEKYANYKNRILEDRIKEFRQKLNRGLDLFLLPKTNEFEQHLFLIEILQQYDKHFNIEK